MKWISTCVDTVMARPSSIVRAHCLWLTAVCLLLPELSDVGMAAQAPSARTLYEAAQASDRDARAALAQSADRTGPALGLARAAIRAYKTVVLTHPTSGYCDDALWYGARLGADAFARFGDERDRQLAVALLKLLRAEYPTSPFGPRIKPTLDHLAVPAAEAAPTPAPKSAPVAPVASVALPAISSAAAPPPPVSTPKKGVSTGAAVPSPPAAPATNGRGGYSIARQLGLRVGRVVIDPGHGGSDPGALGPEASEASIVLDIALKLEALLAKVAGIDVVLTRRSDAYVGLQERTAIANRDAADLFVSIHVNANLDRSVQGIETYLLNFASTPAAAAVAARENAGSTDTMSHLDAMVKQIALNNKIAESRDLATQLQAAMVKRLRGFDAGLRDLGVKQAPFVVLLGASMPSVLVEVAFLTNRRESQLLATDRYRQRVAESLADGVTRYLRSLKRSDGVAETPAGKPAVK